MIEFNLTPQQQDFFKRFLDPKSPTWGNFLQSALGAKYSQEYAESISYQMPNWLADGLGKTRIVQKAEKNLGMALDGLLDDPEKGGKPIQWKATEMALKTQGKELGYTERTELTGKDGKDLIPNKQSDEKAEEALNSYLNG